MQQFMIRFSRPTLNSWRRFVMNIPRISAPPLLPPPRRAIPIPAPARIPPIRLAVMVSSTSGAAGIGISVKNSVWLKMQTTVRIKKPLPMEK